MKNPRTFRDLINDVRVTGFSDERGGWTNDGIWLYLKPGWICSFSGTNTVHEFSVRDCCEAIKAAQYNPTAYYNCCYGPEERRVYLPGG